MELNLLLYRGRTRRHVFLSRDSEWKERVNKSGQLSNAVFEMRCDRYTEWQPHTPPVSKGTSHKPVAAAFSC